jgi:hypothetical protein
LVDEIVFQHPVAEIKKGKAETIKAVKMENDHTVGECE